MSRPEPLTKVLYEALAVHEALRRLNFSADDIYLTVTGPLVVPQHRGQTQICVMLRTAVRGFTVAVGFVTSAPAVISEAWTAALEGWNKTWPESKREAIWEDSRVRRNSVLFLLALRENGFEIVTKDGWERPRA